MARLLTHLLFPHVAVNPNALNKAVYNKTIVITGATFGIGEATALLLSKYQPNLILIARTEEKLAQLCKTVQENGATCTAIVADLYNDVEIDAVIAHLKELDTVDIFISNAGKSITRPLQESLNRFHDYTRTNTLNYMAPVKLLLAITPLLSHAKGTIVNVSALNVLLLPAPKWAAYQASKTAFDQWFRCNAAEWKCMGINAKTAYFPLVRTRMIAPNKRYENYPAMTPQQAAVRVAKLLYKHNTYYKPWWAVMAQTAGFFGRRIWERFTLISLKK